MSLRRRLLATSLAALLIGVGGLVVAGNALLESRVDSESTSLLRGRAEAQIAGLTVSASNVRVRETPNDPVLDRQAWVFSGSRVVERPPGASPELNRLALRLGRARRSAEAAGPGGTRLLSVPVGPTRAPPSGAVVVAASMQSLELLEREVAIGSVVVAALILAGGGVAIRAAVDGALAPVAQMTAKVKDWGAHDLDRRFNLGPARDELTALAETLDHLLARIAASRRHEQRFAGELAHELRTPLAIARGRAELALTVRAEGGEADVDDALRSVIKHADQLEGTIEALLTLARQEFDPASGTVDVVAVAKGFPGIAVTTQGTIPKAEGDSEVVRRALAPIVENARRHARSLVAISVSATNGTVRVAVRDDGPGVDAALGERVFEPGVRGSDRNGGSAGLGLSLARRLARSCGGEIAIGDGPGGCFVLELPALGDRVA